MPCFKPVDVPKKGFADLRVTVACGRCLGCRLDKKREWMVRILDEAALHVFKWFLTLTYDDEHLPRNGSLIKRHVQLWQKRLRKARPDDKIRFLASGSMAIPPGGRITTPLCSGVISRISGAIRRVVSIRCSLLMSWTSFGARAIAGSVR